jgi:Arc/MetJ-type ribon-helix-helix transcriptional regulator
MAKRPYLIVLTEEQEKKLKERAEALGFATRSDYVRFMLFMELSFIEKIDQIHKKVCAKDD